jgi:hypothetical protein
MKKSNFLSNIYKILDNFINYNKLLMKKIFKKLLIKLSIY